MSFQQQKCCNPSIKTKTTVLYSHNDAMTILLLQHCDTNNTTVTILPHDAAVTMLLNSYLQNNDTIVMWFDKQNQNLLYLSQKQSFNPQMRAIKCWWVIDAIMRFIQCESFGYKYSCNLKWSMMLFQSSSLLELDFPVWFILAVFPPDLIINIDL